MIDTTKLLLFIPTMLLISLTPGMCMTLAMTLGMTIGVRRALWMMAGEVTGVALVAGLCGIGVSALMLQFPVAFAAFKLAGGAYMIWLGLQLWRSRGAMAISPEHLKAAVEPEPWTLALQGFVTAIGNPKGWAFFLVLLPSFMINSASPINPHFMAIIGIIVLSDLLCMLLYATGGRAISKVLARRGHVALINRGAGSLMIVVGLWLALS